MKTKLGLLLSLIMIMCVICGCKEKKETFNDNYNYYANEKFIPKDWDWFNREEYNEMLEKNVFVKKEFSEIKKALESKEKVYIYFGYNPYKYQCPFCAAALPIANKAALESNVKEILYLDIYEMRKNNTEEYVWLLDFIQKQVSDFGEKLLVPDIFVVEGGKVLGHHRATIQVINEDGTASYLKGMTEEQKQELKDIYINLFK